MYLIGWASLNIGLAYRIFIIVDRQSHHCRIFWQAFEDTIIIKSLLMLYEVCTPTQFIVDISMCWWQPLAGVLVLESTTKLLRPRKTKILKNLVHVSNVFRKYSKEIRTSSQVICQSKTLPTHAAEQESMRKKVRKDVLYFLQEHAFILRYCINGETSPTYLASTH